MTEFRWGALVLAASAAYAVAVLPAIAARTAGPPIVTALLGAVALGAYLLGDGGGLGPAIGAGAAANLLAMWASPRPFLALAGAGVALVATGELAAWARDIRHAAPSAERDRRRGRELAALIGVDVAVVAVAVVAGSVRLSGVGVVAASSVVAAIVIGTLAWLVWNDRWLREPGPDR